MATNLNRRTILGAAWAAPVIAVAVATPAAAASEPTVSPLVFTNLTATEGKTSGMIYVNTKIMNTGGTATGTVTLYVTVENGHPFTKTWPSIGAWGNTEQVRVEFPGFDPGNHTVYFYAEADGATVEGRTVAHIGAW